MRQHALLRSDKGLGIPGTARQNDKPIAPAVLEERKDHFVERNGVRCAGVHLIIDLYDAEGLDDIVCKKLQMTPPPAELSVWKKLTDALEHPEHRRFVGDRIGTFTHAAATATLAANEGFVDLDVTRQWAMEIGVRHVLAKFMGHPPSRLVGNAQLPL